MPIRLADGRLLPALRVHEVGQVTLSDGATTIAPTNGLYCCYTATIHNAGPSTASSVTLVVTGTAPGEIYGGAPISAGTILPGATTTRIFELLSSKRSWERRDYGGCKLGRN